MAPGGQFVLLPPLMSATEFIEEVLLILQYLFSCHFSFHCYQVSTLNRTGKNIKRQCFLDNLNVHYFLAKWKCELAYGLLCFSCFFHCV